MSRPPLKRGSNSSSVVSLTTPTYGNSSGGGLGSAVSAGGLNSSTGPSRQWASQRLPDAKKMLYTRCSQILAQFNSIPEMRPYLEYVGYGARKGAGCPVDKTALTAEVGIVPPGLVLDDVTIVWRLIRIYSTFAILFNMLRPERTLEVVPAKECTEPQAIKVFLYKFLTQCSVQLGLDNERDLFIIKNVFHNSMGEFLKPLNTLQTLLDRLTAQGTLPADPTPSDDSATPGVVSPPPSPGKASDQSSNPSQTRPNGIPGSNIDGAQLRHSSDTIASSQRDKVVDELLQTERRYLQSLEIMLEYHDAMVEANYKREVIQKMFPYLPKLVEFQRRFLVGIEYHAQLPPQEQQFGWLFAHLREDFLVYEGYTLGQRDATDVALAEVNNLGPFKHILEPIYELQAMLLIPVQRIMRYPLLLKEMLKNTPEDWPHYEQLRQGLNIMQDMMSKVNETQRKAENEHVRRDLTDRLKDSHNNKPDISKMGELLLSGCFPVTIHTLGEQETDYNLYLFERLLLCCRDKASITKKMTPSLKMRPARSSSHKSLTLELKGRIFLDYIRSVTRTRLQQGGHLLSLQWGSDDAGEYGSFAIRVFNEEQAILWEQTLKNVCPGVGGVARRSSTESYGVDDDGARFYEDRSIGSSTIDDLRKLSVSSSERTRWSANGEFSPQSDSSSHMGHNSHTSGSSSLTWNPRYQNRLSQISQNDTPISRSRSASTTTTSLPIIQIPRPRLPEGLDLKGKRKVRVQVDQDSFVILVDPDISYESLMDRVERKLRLTGKAQEVPLYMRYLDEDQEWVNMETDDDLREAIRCVDSAEEVTLLIGST